MILVAKTLLVLAGFLISLGLVLGDFDFSERDEASVISIGGLLVVLFGFVAGAL